MKFKYNNINYFNSFSFFDKNQSLKKSLRKFSSSDSIDNLYNLSSSRYLHKSISHSYFIL